MYRQVTLSALLGGGRPTTKPSIPYNDVREAWRTYLRKYNKGRGVVLISHSQGTFVLRQLVTKEIDPKPAARRKLISAVLLGGDVTVKKGKDVGGDFKHVRACRAPKQLGCVVAFSTFEDPAPANSIFGRTAAAGLEVLCTNPAALGGGSAILHSIYPSAPFAPGTIIATAIKILGVTQPTPPTTWAADRGRLQRPLLLRRRRRRPADHPRAAIQRALLLRGGADVLQIRPQGRAEVHGVTGPHLGPAPCGREHRAGQSRGPGPHPGHRLPEEARRLAPPLSPPPLPSLAVRQGAGRLVDGVLTTVRRFVITMY